MNASGLSVRTWNDAPITRRNSNGYVNATAMCRANGKEWSGFIRNERTTDYIQALADHLGIPADRLVLTTTTGPNRFRGTWVHPRLAVELARWISQRFAVWMDGWFLEELEAKAKPSPSRPFMVLPGEDVSELISVLCADLGRESERLAAMSGCPTRGSLITAADCLALIRRRTAVIHSLLSILQPMGRGGAMASAVAVLQTP
jgi:hypothetical protein